MEHTVPSFSRFSKRTSHNISDYNVFLGSQSYPLVKIAVASTRSTR